MGEVGPGDADRPFDAPDGVAAGTGLPAGELARVVAAVDEEVQALGGESALAGVKTVAVKGTIRQWEPEQSVMPGGDMRLTNDSTFETVVDYDDGLLMHVDTRSFLEWYIFFYGHFRPEISKLLNRMLKPGHVAFDIGSNIGARSAKSRSHG